MWPSSAFCLLIAWLTFRARGRGQDIPPKRLHGVHRRWYYSSYFICILWYRTALCFEWDLLPCDYSRGHKLWIVGYQPGHFISMKDTEESWYLWLERTGTKSEKNLLFLTLILTFERSRLIRMQQFTTSRNVLRNTGFAWGISRGYIRRWKILN